jgi:DNA-binding SARP family transcriptional activator
VSLRDDEDPSAGPPDAALFHARLIGAFALLDAKGRDRLPTLRKTRALIARILLAKGEVLSRQALIDFAWRDREPEQGRASLRQALYEARDLAAGVSPLLYASRDMVRSNASAFDTDLDRQITAAETDDLGMLAAAFGKGVPPLLADLDGVSPAIDAWLAAEREAQRARLAAALTAAAGRALDRGQAAAWAALLPALRDLDPAGDMAARLAETCGDTSHPRPAVAIGAGAAVVLAVAGLAAAMWGLGPARGRVMAVEPLKAAAADAPAQSVRLGLSGELAHTLGGNPAGVAVDQVGDSGVRWGRPNLVVSGNVATFGNRLQAHVQLRNARSGAILWADDFAGDPSHPDVVREQIATKADAVINCALSTRHAGKAVIGDEANRLYLTACDLIEQYRLDEALPPLRQVVRLEPGFARALADLATTEALAAYNADPARRPAAYREAAAAARRALAIDPNTGLADYALAHTMPGIADWQARVAVIARGLKVEPDGSELNNAMAQELARVGRSREAISYFRRSMAADPLNPIKTATLFTALAFDGQLDEAERLIDRALRLWPGSPVIWQRAFEVELQVGDADRAEAMLADLDRLGVRDAGEVEQARQWLRVRRDPTTGNVAAAKATLQQQATRDPGRDPLPEALGLAELGLTDAAFALALDSRNPRDEDNDKLLFDSRLSRFRADPRFMMLAAQRGLTPIWRATRAWPDACETPKTAACGQDLRGPIP